MQYIMLFIMLSIELAFPPLHHLVNYYIYISYSLPDLFLFFYLHVIGRNLLSILTSGGWGGGEGKKL
jgi:hypothetical protein